MASNDFTTKRCTKCSTIHPATKEYFYADKQKSDGLHPHCKTCHTTRAKQYYVENKSIIDASNKQYYIDHRDEVIARTVAYAKAHPEQRRASSRKHYWTHHDKELERNRRCNAMRKGKKREWYFATIDERKAYDKQYRVKNRDAILERGRDYYANNPEKALARWHTRRAREKNAEGFYAPADIDLLYKTQNGKCWWCDKSVSDDYNIDHRIALAIGGTNWPNNLCISCPSCNKSKGSKLPHEWNGRLL